MTKANMDSPLNPNIELVEDWLHRSGGRGLRGDKASTHCHGNTLRFCSTIVAAYPDHLVRDLIAHELAHVFRYSQGELDSYGPDLQPITVDKAGNVWDTQQTEKDADTIMRSWGFDPYGIDKWDLENGVIKSYDLDKISNSTRLRLLKKIRECGR